MIDFGEQEKLFSLIGKECKRSIEVVVIGGSAMLFYNFSKTATKDIDLVVLSERDRKYIVRVLGSLGFSTKNRPEKKSHPHVMVLDDYVIDVFASDIFRLRISKGILSRIKEKVDFGNLTVSVMSPEDIILSKSMTDRTGDREDVVGILSESNVDWNTIIDECVWQSENSDFRFCVYLYDFLDDLVHEFGVKLPKGIVTRIKKLYRDFLDNIKLNR